MNATTARRLVGALILGVILLFIISALSPFLS